MNKVLITGLVLSSCASFAQSTSTANLQSKNGLNKTTKVRGEVEVKGISQSGTMNKATKQEIKASVSGFHKFYPSIDLKFDVGAVLRAGSTDSLFDNNEYDGESGLTISEGAFEYRPMNFISLEAGALRMDRKSSPLLLSGRAMLGLREAIQYGNGGVKVGLTAIQATPSIKNTSDRIDRVEEGTPSYFSEGVFVQFSKNNFTLDSSASHFAFSNLSNGVARESLFNGNSVSGNREDGAEFLYDFAGWNVSNKATLETSAIDLSIHHNYLVNTEAAAGKNKGQLIGVNVKYKGDTATHELGLESFKVESDASVAYYNNKFYGHNNREGLAASYIFNDLGNNFELEATGVASNVIKKSDTQDKETLFILTLRKFYDLF
ncbi:hypothetical protein M899_1845 [Bacteriovorax sp. BSW11_IV]|uniref:hypothetical protein n=1 Tax=Bacteriovorax sp. BSW11_IV TaxID=1353529 RepID=UPI00038A15CD|nr:hypothetical protein [Bacteriovorax sp. BSW11_IV]EQC48416.1 hypothetical protein M899_1845 [Bacteriovorax sp. BSW11_IV]